MPKVLKNSDKTWSQIKFFLKVTLFVFSIYIFFYIADTVNQNINESLNDDRSFIWPSFLPSFGQYSSLEFFSNYYFISFYSLCFLVLYSLVILFTYLIVKRKKNKIIDIDIVNKIVYILFIAAFVIYFGYVIYTNVQYVKSFTDDETPLFPVPWLIFIKMFNDFGLGLAFNVGIIVLFRQIYINENHNIPIKFSKDELKNKKNGDVTLISKYNINIYYLIPLVGVVLLTIDLFRTLFKLSVKARTLYRNRKVWHFISFSVIVVFLTCLCYIALLFMLATLATISINITLNSGSIVFLFIFNSIFFWYVLAIGFILPFIVKHKWEWLITSIDGLIVNEIT